MQIEKDREKQNTINLVLGMLFAFIVALGMAALGLVYGGYIPYTTVCLFLTTGFLILMMVLNPLIYWLYWKQKNTMSVAERIEFLKVRQNKAELDPYMLLQKVKRIKLGIQIYIALLLLTTITLPFFAGAVNGPTVWLLLFSFCILAGFFRRFWGLREKFDFSEYSIREDFPALYALAEKAAQEVGITYPIRIHICSNCNAGVLLVNETISLELGTVLLSVLTEEELYQILLHEFAHIANESTMPNFTTMATVRFLLYEEDHGELISAAMVQLLKFPVAYFVLEYEIYRLVTNEYCERMADQMILTKGSPSVATAALAKTNMDVYFQQEMSRFIPEPFYQPETPAWNINARLCEGFRKAIAERKDFWLELMQKELVPQFVTHPIFRQRWEAYGNCDFEIVLPDLDTVYNGECQKAIEKMNIVVRNQILESYEEERKLYYLEPLTTVEAYEASDGTLSHEQIPQIIQAYMTLGREEDAYQLCDKVLAENPNPNETVYALYIKGCQLLDSYDEQGIDLIYKAMEINHNHYEEGFERIGRFCCLMGLEDKREEYRARYIECFQKDMDEYSKAADLSPSDNLVPEQFLQEKLDDILKFMISAGEGKLKNIYLVRKVISDTYFTSAFVLEFELKTTDDERYHITKAIFHYLDSYPEDWQFSLFQYDVKTAKAVKKVPGSCVYTQPEETEATPS